jgi:metal-responsive CopG/Arc/MetJ family transcriptional regulator
MPSHTIKITGVSDELLKLLDERVRRRHAIGRSEYIRELIRKDVLEREDRSLAEILAAIHAESRSLPDTDDELDAFFEEVRNEVYAEREAGAARVRQ